MTLLRISTRDLVARILGLYVSITKINQHRDDWEVYKHRISLAFEADPSDPLNGAQLLRLRPRVRPRWPRLRPGLGEQEQRQRPAA